MITKKDAILAKHRATFRRYDVGTWLNMRWWARYLGWDEN